MQSVVDRMDGAVIRVFGLLSTRFVDHARTATPMMPHERESDFYPRALLSKLSGSSSADARSMSCSPETTSEEDNHHFSNREQSDRVERMHIRGWDAQRC